MPGETKGPVLVMWMIWAALQTGVFIIYFVIGGSQPEPAASPMDSALWQLALVPVFISTVVRWFALPSARSFQAGFQCMIIGLATAESACIIGLFVYPAHKEGLFAAGALGILQFIPLYARRLVACGEP